MYSAAFIQPAAGTFGTMQRNSIAGPGYFNLDFAVMKDTAINEHVSLQLRVEFFNLLNHPNFALPNFFVDPGYVDNGTPGNPIVQPSPFASPNQGLITQTSDQAQTNPGLGGGGPRVIRIGAKILF
ncbi:MAG TPA: hypothetical protein VMP68_25410 [Candidatus Eisenbacteria bacterium]|nr:hypothetical protein [Candidatus Eisenbacteria bacterium]